jgi:hypothetical protein
MAAPGAVSKCGAGHKLKAMSANQQTWFGQPRGLTILFLTEMWVGTLWARTRHAEFFAILTLMSAIAAAMLFALDRPIRRIEAARAAETIALNATIQPELA